YGGGLFVDALFRQTGDLKVSNNLITGNSIPPLGTTAGLYSHITSPVIVYSDIWSNQTLPSTPSNVGGDFVDAQVIGFNGNTSQDPRFVHAPLFSDVTVAAGTTTTAV